ncbi:MAG: TRAP transporter small permease [Bacteroidota bacterium]
MKKSITKFLRCGTLVSTVLLIASVLLQIFARFLLPSAPAWTEEASRLFFIYAIAFSAGLALESQDYVALDWFFEKLPPRIQKILSVIIAVSVLLLFAIITFYAIQFTILGHQEYSPGMRIRMSFVFFSMVILAGTLSYFAGLELIDNQKSSKI